MTYAEGLLRKREMFLVYPMALSADGKQKNVSFLKEQLEDKDVIHCRFYALILQERINQNERLFVTPAYLVMTKRKIWKDKDKY
jgi:hypothetical protein